MKKSKKIIGIVLALSLMFSVLSIGSSAVLGDGSMLSVDINLEIYKDGSLFVPGSALQTGDVITVRILPQSDFYCGVTRYITMFTKDCFEMVGSGAAAFTPNTANTFFDAVTPNDSTTYTGATSYMDGEVEQPGIPISAWPTSLAGSYGTYTAVQVANLASNHSNSGGLPALMPGTWLFSFDLTVKKDIVAGSGARIWMSSDFLRTPTYHAGAMYFTKVDQGYQTTDINHSSSMNYLYSLDLIGADLNLDPTAVTTSNIIFDVDGVQTTFNGTVGDPFTTAPANPSKLPNYLFKGWDKSIPTVFPEADVMVTAQWVLRGDCDGKPGVLPSDALAVLRHYAEDPLLTGDALIAANADLKGDVLPGDALAILKYYADEVWS